jgi:hypothetical protein
MDPCTVDDSVEIPRRCSFVIEFIIEKLHLVRISTESFTMHGSMNIKFINAKQAIDIQINFGIINSIIKLHLVGISTEFSFFVTIRNAFVFIDSKSSISSPFRIR